ncbi:MAG: hypothetical protein OCD76_20745 [Reichenbachiella sp.]
MLIVVLLTVSFSSFGQLWFGGGYTEAYFSEDRSEDLNGFTIGLTKSIPIKNEKFLVESSFNYSLFMSGIKRELFPVYHNVLSLSGSLGYRLIRLKKFEIVGLVGPSLIWDQKFQASELTFDSQNSSRLKAGVVLGFAVNIQVKGVWFKFVPVSCQWSSNGYRQGVMALYISI